MLTKLPTSTYTRTVYQTTPQSLSNFDKNLTSQQKIDFYLLDSNKNNKLTKQEILESPWYNITQSAATEALKKLDTNKDGNITKEEWAAYYSADSSSTTQRGTGSDAETNYWGKQAACGEERRIVPNAGLDVDSVEQVAHLE